MKIVKLLALLLITIVSIVNLEAQNKCSSEFLVVEDIIRICDNGLYGYSDIKFNTIIKPQYDYGKAFLGGYCVVKKNNKWGVIDVNNKVIVPFEYDEIQNFGNKLFSLKQDRILKLCRINKGNFEIYKGDFSDIRPKDRGFIVVSMEGLFGIVGNDLKELIPCKLENIYEYNDGMICSIIFQDEERLRGYYNEKSKEVIPHKYILATSFDNSMAGVMSANKEIVPVRPDEPCCHVANHCFHVHYHNEYWEIIDKNGNRLIELTFDTVYAPTDGMMAVRKDGKWGFVNNKGNLVVKFEYDRVNQFKDGFAAVEKNGKTKFINKKGKSITEPIYEQIENSYETYTFINEFAIVKKGFKYGVIDKKGKEVVSFDYYILKRYSDGLICAEKNGKYGYIDKKGKVIIDFIYDFAQPFKNKFAYVRHNDKMFIINTKGDCVWNCD